MAGDCDLSNCPVNSGFLLYQPSVPGNAVLLAGFAVLVPLAFVLGYKYRTPIFSTLLSAGLLLEVMSYIGRILLRNDLRSQTNFSLFLFGNVLGSTLIMTAIFSVFPHVLLIYGDEACAIRPRYIGLFFFSVSLLAFVVQVVGIVSASFGLDGQQVKQNTVTLAAGIGVQMVGLILFMGTHFWFALSLSGGRRRVSLEYMAVYGALRFKQFLMLLQLASTLLLLNSIYRLIEITLGLAGSLAQNEIAFMLVDGAVPLLACIALSSYSPGAAFGIAWAETSVLRKWYKQRSEPAEIIQPGGPYRGLHLQQQHPASPAIPKPTMVPPYVPPPPPPHTMAMPYFTPGLRSSRSASTPRPVISPPRPQRQDISTREGEREPAVIPVVQSWTHQQVRPSRKGSRSPARNLVDTDSLW